MISLPAGSTSASGLISSQAQRRQNLKTVVRSIRRLPARSKGSVIFAAALLLFCGLGSPANGQTLVPSWNQQSPATVPQARFAPGLAYDAARGQVVMFGGFGTSDVINDTWLWNGTNWTQVFPANSPSARSNQTMVYDAAQGQVVLFGGATGSQASSRLNDTWFWDGSNWTQAFPSASPPTRSSAAMAYDVATGQVVLFGGLGGSSSGGADLGDTWVWYQNNWFQENVSGPSPRDGASMAYDAAIGEVILFGGFDQNGNNDSDTWAWNGSSWTQLSPANPPLGRNSAGMDYDPLLGQMVLFGGQQITIGPSVTYTNLGDTWVLTGNSPGNLAWAQQTYSNSPAARSTNPMVYDAAEGQIVMFGGYPQTNDTWTWGTPQGFGNINVCPSGQSTPAPCTNTLTLTYNVPTTTNFGPSPTVVTQGATGFDFSPSLGSTCSGSVSAGHTCTVNVTFAPTAPGLREGAVELFTNANDVTPLLTTPIYGIGSAPLAAFSPLTTLVQGFGQTISSPKGVAVDAAGDLFVANTGGNNVLKLSANGIVTTVLANGSGGSVALVNFPESVAVDGAGDVFIGQVGPSVIEIPVGCTQQACQQSVGSLSAAAVVAVDAVGNVFIGDQSLNEVVEVPVGCTNYTTCQITLASRSPLTFGTGFVPGGLAVDLAGDLFIADPGGDKVWELPPGGSIPTAVGSGWSIPQSVALDAAGDLYVADSGLNKIVEVPASCTAPYTGCQIVVASANEPSLGTNFSPYGVAVDSSGDVYIADVGLNRVDTILQQFAGLSFSEATVGNMSGDSPLSVLFQNIGNEALTAAGQGLVFTNPSFTQTSDSGNPNNPAACDPAFSLAPSSACTLSVDFFPLTSGLQTGNNPFTVSGFAVFTDNSLNYSPSTAQNFSLSGASLADSSSGAEYLLTVAEAGSGSGSVIDNMSAISCSASNGSVTGTCSGNYAAGASVTLTASAGSGSTFVSWGGACASSRTNPTCTVIMNQALSVSASFANGNFATANVCPGGIGQAPCSGSFTVTFTPTVNVSGATVQVVTQGIGGKDFTLASTTCASILANSSCTATVTFTPLAPGLRMGAVELSGNHSGVIGLVASIPIYGIGQAPEIAFGPTVTYTLPLTTQGNITFSSQVTALSNPFTSPIEGMTTDAAGNLYMVGETAAFTGELLELAPPYTGTPTVVATGFSTPESVAVDGAGNFYVADPGLHAVVEVLANCSSNCQSTFYTGPEPVAVAVDGLGDVFIADANYYGEGGGDGVVLEYFAGGGGSTFVYNPSGGGATPSGVAVDAAGDVFVTDSGLKQVVEIPAGCNVSSNCTEPLIGSGWVDPRSVAVDPAGDVIVADFAYTVAGQVNAGALEEVPAGCNSSNCQILLLTAGAPDPTQVTVSATGQVFVTTDVGAYEIDQSQPPALTFGNADVGGQAGPLPVTMQNIGTQNLTGSVSLTSQNFSLDSSSNCGGFELTPSKSCTDSFDFSPVSAGALSDQAVVSDNSLNGAPALQNIALSGTGISSGPGNFTLTVTALGAGSGAVTDNAEALNCTITNGTASGTCSLPYSSGSSVTLTATANASTFLGWSGACASFGTSPQCTLTMNSAMNVSAIFQQPSFSNVNVCAGGIASGCAGSSLTEVFNFTTSTTFSTIQVVTQGATGLDFQPASGGTCAAGTYGANSTCTVNVAFTPLAPGLRLGAVELLDSSGNVVASQLINGIGQGALAAFTPFSTTVVPAGALTGPKGVLVDAVGDLFVSDYDGAKVVEVGPSTSNQLVTVAQSPQLHNPQDMAMDGAGNLYVADTNIPGVLEIPWGCTSPSCQRTVPNPMNLTGQFGVSVDQQGDLFVSAYNQGVVVEVPANGGAQTVVYAGNTPIGTVEDAAGDLFVADSNNHQVVKVPPGCGNSVCYQQIGSGWTSPNSVALDAAGDLYVVDGGPHNEVVEFPAGCTTNPCSIILASPSTPSLGSAFNPYDAVVDGQGNVYIGDYGNKRVDELPQSQPPTLGFGTVNVGSQSSAIGFTLLNLGNQALTGTVGSASNSNFGEVQTGSTCGNGNPFSISSGASCVQGVYAQPQAAGPLSGSVTLSDNSLNSNPATQIIPLTATGQGFTLTVIAGVSASVGSGTVTDNFNQINCTVSNTSATGTCSAAYASGTQVILTESPIAGSAFTGWGNACASYALGTTCTVTLNASTNASASFGGATTYPLSVSLVGTGTGSVTSSAGGITCSLSNGTDSGTCAVNYSSGTQVTLTANPTGNSTFVGWGGDCASSGSSTTCLLTVNSALNPIATFVAAPATPPGNLQPITAGIVYGQGGKFTSNTESNGGISANSLADPAGAVLDSNGNLYVGDTGTNRVLFYPRGSATATRVYGQGGSFTTAGNNQGGISANSLNNPYALALDSSSNLYVADLLNNRVLFYPAGSTTATRVYGQNGSFTSNIANNGGISANSLNAPYGVAVDSSGNLYVSDTGNNRVLFYPAGSTTATRVYGQGGSFTTNNAAATANSLNGPLGLTVDSSGDLYVADELNNRVLFYPSGSTTATRVYGQNGSFTSGIVNNGGTSANSLYQPFGVALDSAGDLYIGDTFNNRVLFYPFGSTTATRVYGQLGSFTSNSANPGGVSANTLVDPEAISLDSSGNLYVPDYGNNRVVEFGPFGNVNVCQGGNPTPCSNTITLSYYAVEQTNFGATQVVTQGATGLDFSQANGGTCSGIVLAGNICTVNVNFTPLAPGLRPGAAELYDTGGNLVVSALVSGVGQAPLAAFGPGAQTVLPTTGLSQPSGVALDGAGDVFIADYANNQILKVTPGGAQTTVPTTTLSNPRGVAVDGAGDLFISDAGDNQVLEIPAGCTTSACQVTVPTSGLNISNGGLAVDGAGDIFIADTGNNRVVEVTPAGVQTTVPTVGLHQPFGVAVDAAGDVFIADTDNNRVVEVTAGGVQTTLPTVGVTAPEGVWADAAGDVFIADSIPNNRIVEIPAGGGAQITIYTGEAPEGVATDPLGDVVIADTFNHHVVEINRSVPSSLTFALTGIGNTSTDSPEAVSVQNIGNLALSVTVGSTSTTNFIESQPASPCGTTTPSVLGPGGSCAENFTFTPQNPGILNDSATFSDNTLNLAPSVSLQTINLSGIGSLNGATGTIVPNVVGMTEAAAATALADAGLTLANVTSGYSSSEPAGSVAGENPAAGSQVSLGTPVNLLIALGQAPAPAPNPLLFENNYFVTGDFATAGLSLRGLGSATTKTASGTITIPDSTSGGVQGVPDGADIVDGFLYWETLENTATPSGNTGTFLGYPITGQQVGIDVPYTDGALTGTLRVYRADVNNYFQAPAYLNGERLGSGPFSITLPDSGGSGFPLNEGAGMVVIYRVLVPPSQTSGSHPSYPLKSVVIYDGSTIPTTSTPQTVQGFYDALGTNGELATLYSSGGAWNGTPGSVPLAAHASSYSVTLNPGNAYAAVIFSTPVTNSDNDGILDAWKAGPASPDFFAGEPGYYDVKTQSWVSLPGAMHGEKDLFVQLDYMCGNVLTSGPLTGQCDQTQENLFPAADGSGNDPLAMVQQAFKQSGIVLHLEVGNAVAESSCSDAPGQPLCTFPSTTADPQPGIIGWKDSLEFSKLWPRNYDSCVTGGDCTTRFPYGQKDSYHYVLFGHSLAIPAWSTRFGSLMAISANAGTGQTTLTTTSRGNDVPSNINYCPGRFTISGVLGNPALNGTYNTASCPDGQTIILTTPGVTTWSYPNGLPEPDIGLTSGTVTSISGYSDLGGQDSAVTLGQWLTLSSAAQNMSTRANVIAGTLYHEIGHTIGLSHGGIYYQGTAGNYVPTFDINCKPNYESSMNYLFQLDGVGPSAAVAYSNQTLETLTESGLSGVSNLVDVNGTAASFTSSSWYTIVQPSTGTSQASLHCDGTPIGGAETPEYRVVNGSVVSPGWTQANEPNITFDGVPPGSTGLPGLVGYNDVANVDLRQVGATGGEFASVASILSFGSSSTPLSVPPGGTANVGPGGTATVPPGGSVMLASGGNVTVGSGAQITSSSTITFVTGTNVTFSSTATNNMITAGKSGVFTLPVGGAVALNNTGMVTLTSGGTITFPASTSTISVNFAGGATIMVGGKSVTIPPAGGSYTIPITGATITLPASGSITMGGGGSITMGGGGSITMGGGGSITMGGGGSITMGGGGSITMGGGGSITMGGGGSITMGGGGSITMGGGGSITMGGGGSITMGGGGIVTVGNAGDVSIGAGGTATLGLGGSVTVGIGGSVTVNSSSGSINLSSGGSITMGGGGSITMGGGGNQIVLGAGGATVNGVVEPAGYSTNLAAGGTIVFPAGGGSVTMGGGGSITMGGGGSITMGGGGSITMGGGGSITMGGGGVVSLGGAGGSITMGGGGSITMGGGGSITMGGGGTNVDEMTYGTADSVVRPPIAPTYSTSGNNVQVSWTAPAFGVVQTYTVSREVVDSHGNVIQPATVIGSVSGIGGNAPATTFTDTNPPTTGTLIYTITTGAPADVNNPAPRSSAPSTPAVLTQGQSIVLGPLPSSVVLGNAPPTTITVTATAESSTTNVASMLQVSFSTSGPCSAATPSIDTTTGISSATITLSSTGSCTVTASQQGDSTTFTAPPAYSAATPVSGTFMILPQGSTTQSQTITFGPAPNAKYGSGGFSVSAASSPSGLPVSFTASGPCSVAGTTNSASGTVTGAGLCTITASAPAGTVSGTSYSAASVTQSFNIAAAPLTVAAVNLSSTYGQPLPSLSPNLSVNYTLSGFVNGDTATVVSGAPALSTNATSTSNAGTYAITVSTGTLAAANYSFVYSNGTLTISAGGSTTAASNQSATYSGNSQVVALTASVTSTAGTVNAGTVTFMVLNNGTPVGTATTSSAVTNGTASVNYTLPAGTAAGMYTIQAVYNGSTDFTGSSDNKHTLAINAGGSTTAASNQMATYSASVQVVALTASVTSTAGTVNAGTVTFTVLNGTTPVGTATTSGTLSSGTASVNYTLPAGTSAGMYTIQAVYSGSTDFTGSTDSSHKLTINAGGSTTTASNKAVTYSASSQIVALSASVTSTAGTVNAGTVTFTVLNNGATVGTATSGTVSSGAASVNYALPAGTAAGTYTIQAVYNGSTDFTGSSDNKHTLAINAAGSTTTASNQTATYSASSQVVSLTASVTSTAGPVNGGTVTFTVLNNGTPVGTATTSGTVSSGTASVNYTLPAGTAPATYTIQAVYNSSTNFTGSSDSTHTLTVKFTASVPPSGTSCNGAYSGTFNGNLTVTKGQNCVFIGGGTTGTITETGGNLVLNGSTVVGGVTVSGGTFSIGPSSTLKSTLVVQNLPSGTTTNQLCGSTITGSIQYQKNQAPVLFGSSPSCAGNVMKSTVTILSNTAAVTLNGNKITGGVQVQSNSGTTTTDSNTIGGGLQIQSNIGAAQVFTNVITGSLQCQSNSSITGSGNTASSKSGQCAKF